MYVIIDLFVVKNQELDIKDINTYLLCMLFVCMRFDLQPFRRMYVEDDGMKFR